MRCIIDKGYNIPALTFEKERKKAMQKAIEIAEKEKGDDKKMILSVLIFDRESNNLWIDRNRMHESVIHHVTGGVFSKVTPGEVKLFYKGEYRGMVWNVHEIKEKW